MTPRIPGNAKQTALELELLAARVQELAEQWGDEDNAIKTQLWILRRQILKTARMYRIYDRTGPDCQIDPG